MNIVRLPRGLKQCHIPYMNPKHDIKLNRYNTEYTRILTI
jgi:hypothetical protein